MSRTERAFVLGLCSCLLMLFQGCTSPSRYALTEDAGPYSGFDASKVPDAVPKFEAITEAGNKSPYTVNGQTYHVLDSAEGFRETGIASWYGRKFHGYRTSNGDVYNMYGMTAAHKTLPIPSYVRVTNLKNDRSVIVRVNDRGPFHEGRVIDLSYAAAQKLGYANQGTTPVKLEVVLPAQPAGENGGVDISPQVGLGYFIQVGAYSTESSAEKMVSRLKSIVTENVFFASASLGAGHIHRVRVGPFTEKVRAEQVLSRLHRNRVANAMIIIRPISGQD